jgi:hypothetical protein
MEMAGKITWHAGPTPFLTRHSIQPRLRLPFPFILKSEFCHPATAAFHVEINKAFFTCFWGGRGDL